MIILYNMTSEKSVISIIFDDKYKKQIEIFKLKNYDLIHELYDKSENDTMHIVRVQNELRKLIKKEIFNNINWSIKNQHYSNKEYFACFLAIISDLTTINCWTDFDIKNNFMSVSELSSYGDPNCICCCGKSDLNVERCGLVTNIKSNQTILVGSSCIEKKYLLNCDKIKLSIIRKKKEKLLEKKRIMEQLRLEEKRQAEQQRLKEKELKQQLAEQQRIEQQIAEKQRIEQFLINQRIEEKQRIEQQIAEQQRIKEKEVKQRLAEQQVKQRLAEQQRIEQQVEQRLTDHLLATKYKHLLINN